MAQQKTYDLTQDLLNAFTLSDTENVELQKILQNPVVVKYFKSVGYAAMVAQGFLPLDKLATNVDAYQLEQAYQKGILSIVDTILNNTPKLPT